MWHYSMFFLQVPLKNTLENFMLTFQILKHLLEKAQGSPLIYSIIMGKMVLMAKLAIYNHKAVIVTEMSL